MKYTTPYRTTKTFILVIITLLFATLAADEPTDKHTRRTSTYGDEGTFSGDDPNNTNALILWPGETASIIRRKRPDTHTASDPKAFKVRNDWSKTTGFPINLKNDSGFCSFVHKIDTEPDLHACICDDSSGPTTGDPVSCTPSLTLSACTPAECDGSSPPPPPPVCPPGQVGTPPNCATPPPQCAGWTTSTWAGPSAITNLPRQHSNTNTYSIPNSCWLYR